MLWSETLEEDTLHWYVHSAWLFSIWICTFRAAETSMCHREESWGQSAVMSVILQYILFQRRVKCSKMSIKTDWDLVHVIIQDNHRLSATWVLYGSHFFLLSLFNTLIVIVLISFFHFFDWLILFWDFLHPILWCKKSKDDY